MSDRDRPAAAPPTSPNGNQRPPQAPPSTDPPRGAGARRWTTPFVRIADILGSLWFGVVLMVLVFLYSWLGSAGTAPFHEWFVRQTFEKTEMEWFAWWPFQLLVGLLAVSLALATVRRIRFDLPNLGVWAVHAGVLVLLLGAVIYFGRKVEGDMLVFRRTAVLAAGGAPVELPLQAGAEAVVAAADGGSYRVQITDLNPEYTLLTGAEAGRKVFAAQLAVQPFGVDGRARDTFVRQVLVDYPQFTEDVLPGRGRAAKVLGRSLVDEALQVTLAYAPTQRIFLANRAALHVRLADDGRPWAELPLPDLPRYRERLASWDDVWTAPGDTLPAPEALALDSEPKSGGAPLPSGVRVRVTGFLPFAVLQERVEAGGEGGAPLLRASIELGEQVFTPTLVADDAQHGETTLGDGLFDVRFRWLADRAELERWMHPPTPTVLLRVPALDLERVVTLTELMAGPVELAGSGYTIEGLRVVPKWSTAGPFAGGRHRGGPRRADGRVHGARARARSEADVRTRRRHTAGRAVPRPRRERREPPGPPRR